LGSHDSVWSNQALARYGVGQDAVEGRDAVGGDDQHVAGVDVVNIADLAARAQRQGFQVALIKGFRSFHDLGFMK